MGCVGVLGDLVVWAGVVNLSFQGDNLLPASDFPADAKEPLLSTGQVAAHKNLIIKVGSS